MKYFLVFKTEYSGYECEGHRQTYIVAANTPEEAKNILSPEGENPYDRMTTQELILPNLERKKKPFVLI